MTAGCNLEVHDVQIYLDATAAVTDGSISAFNINDFRVSSIIMGEAP